MLLLLNIFAPTTTDVRVVNYIVPVVSQVRGRVIEVPVENNRPVKKGDVLFRIDPTPYQNEVHSLEAQARVGSGAGHRRPGERWPRPRRSSRTRAPRRAPVERAAESRRPDRSASLTASFELARTRVKQNTELVADRRRQPLRSRAGADQRQRAHRRNWRRRAPPSSRCARSSRGRVDGDLAGVAEVKAQIATAQAQVKVSEAQVATTEAQLDNAKWDLSQTTVRRTRQRHDGQRDAAARASSSPACRSTRS